ncbi:hypothetical protein ABT364_04595 [Massilia sp. SR12]
MSGNSGHCQAGLFDGSQDGMTVFVRLVEKLRVTVFIGELFAVQAFHKPVLKFHFRLEEDLGRVAECC